MTRPASAHSLLPGRSASFSEPFEMLAACHERIERTLALLQRLRAHLRAHGTDEQARQAARDVLRYFDLAAPQHHRDEELHVFPPLLERGGPAQAALVQRLRQDHRAMESAWAAARRVLASLAEGTLQRPDGAGDAALDAFTGLYAGHLAAENDLAYPAVLALLDAGQLAAMGREMATRRGIP